MTNQRTLYAILGSIAAAAILILYTYVSLQNGSPEALINHAIAITFAAFFAIIGYEDWKDAQQANKDDD